MFNDTVSVGSNEAQLSKNEIFHILQNSRRRHVLQYLVTTTGPAQISDVAEQVAAWEYDTTVEEITSQQRQRVYISLYQSHLSKLAEFDLITYDRESGRIESAPTIDQLARYLDEDEISAQSAASTQPWVWYYTVSTGVSALLIGVVWTDIGMINQLIGGRLALVITLIYTSMTVAMAANSYYAT
jgi:hypothetical protein